MKARLKDKLLGYIVHHNPDLLFRLQQTHTLKSYIEEKVNSVMPLFENHLNKDKPYCEVEQMCMDAMTEDLKPSRYLYLRAIIEEEFPDHYEWMSENGTLTYELIYLIDLCRDIFKEFEFNSENEDNRQLKYAIIKKIDEYFA